MPTFDFEFVLGGVQTLNDDEVADLRRWGCEDATVSSSGGRVTLTFAREARDVHEAVKSALEDVANAGFRVTLVKM